MAVGNREVALSGQAAFGKMHGVVLGQEGPILRVNSALIFLILSTLHLFLFFFFFNSYFFVFLSYFSFFCFFICSFFQPHQHAQPLTHVRTVLPAGAHAS